MWPVSEVNNSWPSTAEAALVCGARIRELRIERGLSQGALASRIQVSKTMVTKYERGRNMPPAAALMRLASVLRVPVDTVLGYAAPDDPRLVHCLQEIRQLDDESRQAIVATLETVLSASWVAITITGRIKRLSVRPPAQSVGPNAIRLTPKAWTNTANPNRP